MYLSGALPKLRMDSRVPLLYLEHAYLHVKNSCVMCKCADEQNTRAVHCASYSIIPRIRDMTEDDTLNRAITMCNMALYGIATSIIYGLGFLPHFGIVHGRGSTPLAYDISDVFKCRTTIPCAMNHIKNNAIIDRKRLMAELCEQCETIPSQMVDLLNRLFLRT